MLMYTLLVRLYYVGLCTFIIFYFIQRMERKQVQIGDETQKKSSVLPLVKVSSFCSNCRTTLFIVLSKPTSYRRLTTTFQHPLFYLSMNWGLILKVILQFTYVLLITTFVKSVLYTVITSMMYLDRRIICLLSFSFQLPGWISHITDPLFSKLIRPRFKIRLNGSFLFEFLTLRGNSRYVPVIQNLTQKT